MTVKPSGKTHFCAELGGKVITAESSVGVAFKLAVLNIVATTSARPSPGSRGIITILALADLAAPRPREQLVSRARTALRTPPQNRKHS